MHRVTSLSLAVVLLAAASPAAARGDCCCRETLHDGFRTAAAGLEREWILRVPFSAAGWRLSKVVVGDGLVVALSSDGGVHAIQAAGSAAESAAAAAPGTLLWTRPIGRPFVADEPPGVSAALVAVPRDFAVHGIDARTGQTSWRVAEVYNVTAGATIVDNWVYVPTDSNRIIRYPVDPRRPGGSGSAAGEQKQAKPARTAKPADRRGKGGGTQFFEAPTVKAVDAGGRVSIPVQRIDDGVVWCTETGRIVALQLTDLGWKRWQFNLDVPLAGPPAIRGRSLFAATVTEDLVRIDLRAAEGQGLRYEWQAPLGLRPDAGPFVIGDVVLVPLGEEGIAAYGVEDGGLRWRSPISGTIVAAVGGRAWCLDRTGRLTALDPRTGLVAARLCLGGFSVRVENTTTERLVLASPDGVVTSLAARPAAAAGVSGRGAPAAAPASADPAARPR